MSIVRPPDEASQAAVGGSSQDFARYYHSEAGGGAARARAAAIHAQVTAALGQPGGPGLPLRVAEIGCGDGTGCRLWAERGHQVHGLDNNRSLLALARKRAASAGLEIDFELADPAALPWPDSCMDLCIVHSVLEHAPDWRACLREVVRVLKPGGALYLSTSNRLRALPARGDQARAPLHFFSYYSLRDYLARHGLHTQDRFDLALHASRRPLARAGLQLVRALPLLRLCGQVASAHTVLLALKPAPSADCCPCAAGSGCCCGPKG